MAVYKFKRGSLEKPMTLTLTDASGAAVPLTGATGAQLRWRDQSGTVRTKTITISDAAAGKVSVSWDPGETDIVGLCEGEVIVTYPTNRPQIFPGEGFFTWIIEPTL